MFVPVPSSPTGTVAPARSDAVDLKVAIKLLSGTECERDASQAQKMLLRLVESHDRIVSADATRLVKAGVSNRWFTDKTPHHYELERIAEATLTRLASSHHDMRRGAAVLVGIGLLVAGMIAFAVASGDQVLSGENSPVLAVVVGIAVTAIAIVFGIRNR